MTDKNKILCAVSKYEEKYYLNPDFNGLPDGIKDELQAMCVLFAEDIGGILTMEFDLNNPIVILVLPISIANNIIPFPSSTFIPNLISLPKRIPCNKAPGFPTILPLSAGAV